MDSAIWERRNHLHELDQIFILITQAFQQLIESLIVNEERNTGRCAWRKFFPVGRQQ